MVCIKIMQSVGNYMKMLFADARKENTSPREKLVGNFFWLKGQYSIVLVLESFHKSGKR